MGLTQKYKQQQQQVRVHTNESSYLKGMWFSDVPLAEGYSRMLVNFDIDTMSGSLKPRRGLQSLGFVHPDSAAREQLSHDIGYNTVIKSKVCAVSDAQDPRKTNDYLQAILYNTATRTLLTATCAVEAPSEAPFKATPFNVVDAASTYIAPEPFIIAEPEIHGRRCMHNNYFKRPVGTFAYGDSFYTFLAQSNIALTRQPDKAGYIDDLPLVGDKGHYYVFIGGADKGKIAYYDKDGKLAVWEGSEADFCLNGPAEFPSSARLCYTKLGANIQSDEVVLGGAPDTLIPDKYYVCVAQPKQLNPTEASSWGYNMLLQDPYAFVCENTAVNLVSILGILPYDKTGKVTLTPRKNQEITLKGYYRAPAKYYSDTRNVRSYATTRKTIQKIVEETVLDTSTDTQGNIVYTTDGTTYDVYYGYVINNATAIQRYYRKKADGTQEIVEESTLKTKPQQRTINVDPETENDLPEDLTTYAIGDWWYVTGTSRYYMVMPNTTINDKIIGVYGTTQPAASVSLRPKKYDTNPDTEDIVRVKWQMRSSGAATWTDIFNETFTLSEYYKTNGDHAPFAVTLTLPDNEVLIKLTISDPTDPITVGNTTEEYVLSTNTIGVSAVSDELANTLNLDAKNFDLGQCTGMCEWEQRLVLWGVPGALNTIFISDVGNPTFFPYPNNVDIFTEPVIAVHNYGNELLVLTTSALYRLIWDAEGTGWSHRLVQQNLHVTKEDTYMSCVIKNMFFFKSGEQYYMMVPKATASTVRGEVTIAPISKPIEHLLNNFHSEIYELVKVMLGNSSLKDFTQNLVNYFSYVDSSKVVVNYVYALDNTNVNSITQDITDSKYLYVQLIYDTELRTWTTRIFEAAHMLYASHADAIQQDRFIDITPALNSDNLVLQYYKFTGLSDFSTQYIDVNSLAQPVERLFKNYQYLDTGNREINTELKKRFREFQFKLKNTNATNLGFFTSFLIDGSIRKDLQQYAPRYILDEHTGEGTIVVERVLDPESMTYKTTNVERIVVPERMLQDAGELTPTVLTAATDADKWILNQSAFPGRTLWKIRMPISGKGFAPRAILLSTNELDYEILGHSWVYRTMHAR